MADNRKQWDAWREAENARSRKNIIEITNDSVYINQEKHIYKDYDLVRGLMKNVLKLLEENAELREKIDKLSAELLKWEQESIAQYGNKPEYIRLYMMMPFGSEYRPVEEALRKIFEQKPFWFEVRLVHEYSDSRTLLKNIQTHIASSHGFLAEISELSPDVMMEVGSVLMSGDERPLFAIRSKDGKQPPVDFGDLLTFSYENRMADADTIAEDIKKQIFTDGRLSNKDLRDLCELRDAEKMKRFLSRVLLENLPEYIHLGKDNIEKICKKYSTVEQFVEADESSLNAMGTDCPSAFLKVVQDELHKQMAGNNGG